MAEKIAALYTRVSTDMQKERGESVEFQKARLVEYAKEQGLAYQVYDDAGFSAKDSNRPALKRLIADIESQKVGIVLVVKIDRITRQMRDLCQLLMLFEAHSVGFKSLTQPIDTTTTIGRGMLNVLVSFGQMEREMTSDRVGEHMVQRAKNGKWNGGINAYGYTSHAWEVRRLMKAGLSKDQADIKAIEKTPLKKKLYVCPKDSEVVKKIYEQYLKFESLRAVTHWLNDNGYKTPNGMTWAATSVRRILNNPTYYGAVWYNKRSTSKLTGKLKNNGHEKWIIVPGGHEPIINKETFDRVQEIIKRQAVEPKRKLSDYLLSGLVRCGCCNASMNGYSMTKTNSDGDKTYSYYKCHNVQSKGHSVCKAKAITKEFLEDAVVDTILNLAESKKFKVDMKKALDEFNKQAGSSIKPMQSEKERLIQELKDIEAKKKNLVMYLADKTLDRETYKASIFALDQKADIANSRLFELDKALSDSSVQSISFNAVYEIIQNFKTNWKNFDYLAQKELLWCLVSKVLVFDEEIRLELFFIDDLFSVNPDERMSVRLFH